MTRTERKRYDAAVEWAEEQGFAVRSEKPRRLEGFLWVAFVCLMALAILELVAWR